MELAQSVLLQDSQLFTRPVANVGNNVDGSLTSGGANLSAQIHFVASSRQARTDGRESLIDE